mgnify:FL=1
MGSMAETHTDASFALRVVSGQGLYDEPIPETSPLRARFAERERLFQSSLMIAWQIQASRLITLLRLKFPNKMKKTATKMSFGDQEFWDAWRAVYSPIVIQFLSDAAEVGGSEALGFLAEIGIGLDMPVARAVHQRWAVSHGLDLVRGMAVSDKRAIQAELRVWLDTNEGFAGLVDRLNRILRNVRRAELIAATESTNAFFNGNVQLWRESNVVVGKRWRTATDERVCTIC